MRLVGNTLMVVGASFLVLATMGLFGMNVRVNGADTLPVVTGLLLPLAGAGLIVAGAWLRRLAKRRSAPHAAV
jgi:hypothetical protein